MRLAKISGFSIGPSPFELGQNGNGAGNGAAGNGAGAGVAVPVGPSFPIGPSYPMLAPSYVYPVDVAQPVVTPTPAPSTGVSIGTLALVGIGALVVGALLFKS